MNQTRLIVGDGYKSLGTPFLWKSGVGAGVDYALTCQEGDKISLKLKHLNGSLGPDKLTILKSYFGVNFAEDRSAVVNSSYGVAEHFFPKVSAAQPLLTSSRGTGGERRA